MGYPIRRRGDKFMIGCRKTLDGVYPHPACLATPRKAGVQQIPANEHLSVTSESKKGAARRSSKRSLKAELQLYRDDAAKPWSTTPFLYAFPSH